MIKDKSIVSIGYDKDLFNGCGKSVIYTRNKSGIEIDPCGATQSVIPASEKTFSSVKKKKKNLFDTYD